MFSFISNWLNRRIIRQSTISSAQWDSAFVSLPLLDGLSSQEMQSLKELAILFMHKKRFEGAHALEITETMKLVIALQACLPILYLGLDAYQNWMTVVIYPAGFSPERVVRDEYGVEHYVRSNVAGEAWQRGPVLLAWDETRYAGIIDGHNLVIHEFAHKLDMQNGVANGYPPLHRDMSVTRWTEVFTAGFEDFQHKCDRRESIGISCYGATSPAEFFAVLSEVFFEQPETIRYQYSAIYDQLRQYYRQDPLSRTALN
jgi:Mlc titration factor MtfA (ptsG expression regulator)